MSTQKTTTEALRRQIATTTGIPIAKVSAVMQALALIIGDDLAEGRRTRLEGIGTLSAEPSAPRDGVSPNGQPWETTGGMRVKFKPAQDLKRRVRVLHETE